MRKSVPQWYDVKKCWVRLYSHFSVVSVRFRDNNSRLIQICEFLHYIRPSLVETRVFFNLVGNKGYYHWALLSLFKFIYLYKSSFKLKKWYTNISQATNLRFCPTTMFCLFNFCLRLYFLLKTPSVILRDGQIITMP